MMFKLKGFVLMPVIVGLVLLAAIAYLLTSEGAMNININSSEMQTADAKYVAEAGLQYKKQILDSSGCTGYSTSPETVNLDVDRSFTVTANATSGAVVPLASAGKIGSTEVNASVIATIYGDTQQQTLVLQGGAGTSDTMLDAKFPTYNSATLPNLDLFNKTGGLIQPIIKFDLNSIPRGSVIKSASLEMYATNITTGTWSINLHKLTKEWDVGTVTWASSKAGTPWTIAGGDFESTATDSRTLTAIGWLNFNVTSLVGQWVNESASNNGVVLLPPMNANISFASSEHATTTLRPKLTVNFIGPRQHKLLKGTTGKDSYITRDTSIDPDKNVGKDVHLVLDNGGKAAFPLIKFDLAPVPAAAKLTYANLVMTVSTQPTGAFKNTRGNGTIPLGTTQTSIHGMLKDWKEGTGTSGTPSTDGVAWNWADRSNNINWTSPTPSLPAFDGSLATQFINSNIQTGWNNAIQGGNYDNSYDAQYPNFVPYQLIKFFETNGTTLATPAVNTVSWNITTIMSDWLASPAQNHGLLIRADSALAQAKFHSFDSADPRNHPRLEVGYYMPCGSNKPVTVSSQFAPPSIFKNQTTTLTITLSNPNTAPMDVVSAFNSLPADLSLAPVANNLTTDCPGIFLNPFLSSNVSGGITTIQMLGARIPVSSNCTITAIIKPNAAAITTTAKIYANTILPNDVITTDAAAPTNLDFTNDAVLTVKPPSFVTLTSIADTSLWKTASLATSNCGICAELAVSTPNANQVNSLFNFNLSGIPAASTVTNAKLRLYVTQIVNRTAGLALTLQVSPLTKSWVEGTNNVASSTGGTTWKIRSTALGNWTAQGGDFSPVNAATAIIPGSFAGTLGAGMWIEFDVTAATQAMVGSPAANFGFHAQMTTVATLSNETRLAARENTTPAGTAPQLVVTYQ